MARVELKRKGQLKTPYVPPRPPVRWPRETQIAALQGWAAAHDGRRPTDRDLRTDRSLPSPSTVRATFRSLARALAEAGLTTPEA